MAEPGARIVAVSGMPAMGIDPSGNAQHFKVGADGGLMLNGGDGDYETVAASQTDQVLGATGAAGDYLEGLLITPGVAAAGAVSLKDGNGSSIPIFAGGAVTALPSLVPFYVPIGAKALNATTPGWKVTTGTNVTVVGFGNFT